jgi:stage III sporulation protein AF
MEDKMEKFYAWLNTIAMFMLLLPVISQILGNSVYKKYIDYFMGMLFLVILLEPITDIFSLNEVLEEKIRNWSLDLTNMNISG